LDQTARFRQSSTALQKTEQFLNELERAPRVHGPLVFIEGVVKNRQLLRAIMVDGLELVFQNLDGCDNEGIVASRLLGLRDDLDGVGMPVETIADVVDILRLVAASHGVSLHRDEVWQRRHSQVYRVWRTGDH
jgi:hypothetical protein